MAEVKRTTMPAKGKPVLKVIRRPGAALAVPTEKLSLPTEKSTPVTDINQYSVLCVGEPGVGKTTLAMQEEGVLLLTWDPFQKSLAAFQRHVARWEEFEGYVKLLEGAAAEALSGGKPFPYRRIIVDGCDLWYRACQTWVCEKLKIDHPADEGWAKGWDMLSFNFTHSVDRLLRLPCGNWFIAHSKWKEIESRSGFKSEKLVAALGGRAEETLFGKSDMLLNIRYDGKERVGTIRGSDEISAKCRIDPYFWTTPIEGKKRQVVDIVLGNQGPKEAWRRLNLAFNNKQPYATLEEFRASLKKGVNPYKSI